MTNSWVLRWDTLAEEKPKLLLAGDVRPSQVDFFEAESGNFVLFDGYLFPAEGSSDRPRESEAAQVALAYRQRGESFVDGLRGGFTLAVWDHQRSCLITARDAMGLSPCFYHWDGRHYFLSTSLEAMTAQPEVGRLFNLYAVGEYLQGYCSGHQREETFFRNVRRLPSAHWSSLRKRALSITRYWDPIPPGFSWADREELSRFQPILERSVSRCLSAGADSLALSGGFDSVSLAILAAEQLKGSSPLHAVSLRFDETVCDEGETQVAVPRALGMPQLLRTVRESLGGESFVAAALALSKSSPSPVLTMWQSMYTGLLRSASALHLRRMLMGTGGDDLFNVDPSYGADLLATGQLGNLWRFFRAWQRTSPFPTSLVAREVLWYGAARPELNRFVGTVYGHIPPAIQTQLRKLRRRRDVLKPWISRQNAEFVSELEQRRRTPTPIEMAPGERSYVRRIRSLPQAPLLLLELDQGIIWARNLGFTLLYPYFDRDLVELLLRVHPEYLLSGGHNKTPLRRLVAERLPSVPLRKKKVDFTQMDHELLLAQGKDIWKTMKGPTMLAELGLVDPDVVNRFMNDYFAGRDTNSFRTWIILSTEAWLRAHSQSPSLEPKVSLVAVRSHENGPSPSKLSTPIKGDRDYARAVMARLTE